MTDQRVGDDIRQLWREVLVKGIEVIGRGARVGVNDVVHMADEMVRRYVERFEPGSDVTALLATFEADKARVQAERDEMERAEQAKAVKQFREAGPWSAGTPLVMRSSGERVTVLKDDRGSSVRVKFASGRRLDVERANLAWPSESETNGAADTDERPPLGLVQ